MAQKALSEAIDEGDWRSAVPQLDDAAWAAKEAEIAAERAMSERRKLEDWRIARGVELRVGGAPACAIDLVLGDRFNGATAAALDLSLWNGKGVRTLAGGVGVGKTVAAVWWLAHRGGSAPAFARAAAIESVGRYDKAFRALWTGASALVLDDLGNEFADSKGNLLAVLDEMVDLYHADGRPLIVTTNLKPDAFKARYGERIASRIRQGSGWRALHGTDLRNAGDAR